MRHVAVALIACLLFAAPIATAEETVAVYSNVCWHEEAGDLLGDRMAILQFSDGPYVLVQSASGEWEQPTVAKASAADFKRGKLVFDIPGRNPASFHGTINEKVVAGRFDGRRDDKGKPLVVHLNRSSASKKRVPNC